METATNSCDVIMASPWHHQASKHIAYARGGKLELTDDPEKEPSRALTYVGENMGTEYRSC